MTKRELDVLTKDVYIFVFNEIDAMPEYTGMEAGYIATKAAEAVKVAVEELEKKGASE